MSDTDNIPKLTLHNVGKQMLDNIPWGVHLDMPAEVYHALTGASASILKKFWGEGVTPAHAKVEIDAGTEPSDAMIKGTFVHAGILEPGKPLPKIEIEPDTYPAGADHAQVKKGAIRMGDPLPWHNGAKACKQWRSLRDASGVTVLKRGDYEDVQGMVKAVCDHETARAFFLEGKPEVSMVLRDEETKLPMRCRIDFVPAGDFLADIKTTRAADKETFTKLAYEAGYHIQAALYLDMWNALCGVEERKTEFKIVAVENKAPYAVNVFRCTDIFLSHGRACYTRLLARLARCLATGEWPAFPPGEVELGLHRFKFANDYDA